MHSQSHSIFQIHALVIPSLENAKQCQVLLGLSVIRCAIVIPRFEVDLCSIFKRCSCRYVKNVKDV